MDWFVAPEKIREYREMLWRDIEPTTRSRLQKLLVEEEDKLGKDLELLADIQRHIDEGARRIWVQQSRVRTMQLAGRGDVGRAQALLDGLIESQEISMRYHQRLAKEIDRNRLLDR